MKPFSQACENNKQPILEALTPIFKESSTILEIGSGTGQHAVFMAANLPHLIWQTSDREDNIPGIRAWLEDAPSPNCKMPLVLDVSEDLWPISYFDGVFSANTSHIMDWQTVHDMFTGIGKRLKASGVFVLYGPFNYQGQFTSLSNQQFDTHLKLRDPQMGIRDFEDIENLAKSVQLFLIDDIAMPANNRLLVFKKDSAV
ncbi:MAG: DUF938 domain-containing protein [Pseudomonadota bacterium]